MNFYDDRFVFVDMDGVVADFNKLAGKLLQRPIAWEGRPISHDEWLILKKYPRFYYNLEPTDIASELISTILDSVNINNVQFLTAITRSAEMQGMIRDKIEWAEKYFPGIPVKFGPEAKDKKRWCRPGDILIDDKHSNILEWTEVGGIAIHHIDDGETIEKIEYHLGVIDL